MSDPNDPRPIRVFVFPDRPDVLLVYVPEGQELWLPRLATPFQRHEVAKKLGDAGIPATVRESVAGRFTKAMELSKNADEATRVQRQREDEAARHIRIKFDDEATTYEKKRSSLILAKNEIDEEIRNLKIDVGKAMSYASTTGRYAPARPVDGEPAVLRGPTSLGGRAAARAHARTDPRRSGAVAGAVRRAAGRRAPRQGRRERRRRAQPGARRPAG